MALCVVDALIAIIEAAMALLYGLPFRIYPVPLLFPLRVGEEQKDVAGDFVVHVILLLLCRDRVAR